VPAARSARRFELTTAARGQIKIIVHRRASIYEEESGSYGSMVAGLGPELVVDACCYEDFHSKLVTDALQGCQTLKHFIHCGNLRAYNPTVKRPWIEDGPRGRPSGFYSLQQQLMEARLLQLHRDSSFPATVVLMAELVGQGWCPVTPQGLYDPTCFDALTKPGSWIMIPEQKAVLQFLDVRDAVAALCAMVAKRDAVTS
jgi:hypothetical protein